MNMGVSGQVTVTEKKSGAVIFDADVDTGGEFTFNGSDDKGTMGTEIYIAVDSVQNIAIHTSCSQLIAPEMIFGAFKVIEGYSRNGGLLASGDCVSNEDKTVTKKCDKKAKKACEKEAKKSKKACEKECEKGDKECKKECKKAEKESKKLCSTECEASSVVIPQSLTCTDESEIAHVEKLFDPNATNYLAGLNLVNPVEETPQIAVVNNEVIFNNYNEQDIGLATFELDQTIDFVSMLTFTANVESGLFMPRMSGDDGTYMTTDVRKTLQYGFIFPDILPLSELNFTTWGVSFTGSVLDLSIVEVTNTNILEKEQQ